MNYLSAENISKSYGEKVLFNNISFGLSKGDKVALVANNGTGKSTLLRILARVENPDTGEINSKQDISTGFLPQEPELDDKLILLDQVMLNIPNVSEAIRSYELALVDNDTEKLASAISEMDRLSAWDFESRVKEKGIPSSIEAGLLMMRNRPPRKPPPRARLAPATSVVNTVAARSAIFTRMFGFFPAARGFDTIRISTPLLKFLMSGI